MNNRVSRWSETLKRNGTEKVDVVDLNNLILAKIIVER
jgi:hypothetical protein